MAVNSGYVPRFTVKLVFLLYLRCNKRTSAKNIKHPYLYYLVTVVFIMTYFL